MWWTRWHWGRQLYQKVTNYLLDFGSNDGISEWCILPTPQGYWTDCASKQHLPSRCFASGGRGVEGTRWIRFRIGSSIINLSSIDYRGKFGFRLGFDNSVYPKLSSRAQITTGKKIPDYWAQFSIMETIFDFRIMSWLSSPFSNIGFVCYFHPYRQIPLVHFTLQILPEFSIYCRTISFSQLTQYFGVCQFYHTILQFHTFIRTRPRKLANEGCDVA